MSKIGTLAAVGAAIALTVAAPLTASAAPNTAAPKALAQCTNGAMLALYDANVYSGWNSFRVVGSVDAGYAYICNPGYNLGRRYTACGQVDGNGWVRLSSYPGGPTTGWSPQACFSD